MTYEEQMHEYIKQKLLNCLYYKGWLEEHEEEIKDCIRQMEDETVDDMDKEYCAMVLDEYKKAIEEIDKNIKDIDITAKDKIKLTENEQEIYNGFKTQKYIIL